MNVLRHSKIFTITLLLGFGWLLSLIIISCDPATRRTFENQTNDTLHVLYTGNAESDPLLMATQGVLDPSESTVILGSIQSKPEDPHKLTYLVKAFEFIEGNGNVVKREGKEFIYDITVRWYIANSFRGSRCTTRIGLS